MPFEATRVACCSSDAVRGSVQLGLKGVQFCGAAKPFREETCEGSNLESLIRPPRESSREHLQPHLMLGLKFNLKIVRRPHLWGH